MKIICTAFRRTIFRPTLFVAVVFGAALAATPLHAASTGGSTGGGSTSSGASGTTTSGTRAGEAADLSSDDRKFVEGAAEKGMIEVAAARLAVNQAQNTQVRTFAQKLLEDHQAANTKLREIATRHRMALPADARYDDGGSVTTSPGAPGSGRVGTTATGGSTSAGQGTADRDRAASGPGVGGNVATGTAGTGADMGRHHRALRDLAGKTGAEFDQAFLEHMVEGHEKSIELFEEAAEDCENPALKQFAAAQLPVLREHHQQARSLKKSAGKQGDASSSRSTGPNEGAGATRPGSGASSGSTP